MALFKAIRNVSIEASVNKKPEKACLEFFKEFVTLIERNNTLALTLTTRPRKL